MFKNEYNKNQERSKKVKVKTAKGGGHQKMGMSDRIEAFILELLKQEQEDWLKIQRNELAQIFGCVPSQINYVIATRFNPERGYITESRRGGGGYVMIRRVTQPDQAEYLVGELSQDKACERVERLLNTGKIDPVSAAIMEAALSDRALVSAQNRNKVRADIFNNIMEAILK